MRLGRHTTNWFARIPALLLAVLLGAGVATAAPPGAAGATGAPTVHWGACPAASAGTPRDPAQECGTLAVPLDYRRPGGRSIELAVSRIRAADPAQRRGILLFNPGGPGGRGLDFPGWYRSRLPQAVVDRYDLVGFDPRGVGFSTPVTCGIDLAAARDLLLPYPAADGSIDANVAFARQTAAGCAEHGGDLLPYLTTANTARDMDRIRAALGERRLSYFGLSYGTYLGAVYASLFGDRTDRMVLDSAVDPDRVWYRQWSSMGEAVALRFPDFAGWAASRHDLLGFGSTADAVTTFYLDLLATLDAHPIVLGQNTLTGNLLREATRSELYEDDAFPELADDWTLVASLVQQSKAPAAAQRAAVSPGQPDAIFNKIYSKVFATTIYSKVFAADAPTADAPATVPADNTWAARYAVVCGDAAWPTDIAVYRSMVAEDRAAHPLTAGMPANLWPCPFWATSPVELPVRVTAHGPRNILILQHRRDPATPWATGVALRRTLGTRAAFVGVDGGSHGVYGRGSCADAVTDAFLTTGGLPTADLFC